MIWPGDGKVTQLDRPFIDQRESKNTAHQQEDITGFIGEKFRMEHLVPIAENFVFGQSEMTKTIKRKQLYPEIISHNRQVFGTRNTHFQEDAVYIQTYL